MSPTLALPKREGNKKEWLTPKGQRLGSHTKTLMEGGFCPESVEPSHIGEGRVRVDVSFASFLCAREKEEEKNIYN